MNNHVYPCQNKHYKKYRTVWKAQQVYVLNLITEATTCNAQILTIYINKPQACPFIQTKHKYLKCLKGMNNINSNSITIQIQNRVTNTAPCRNDPVHLWTSSNLVLSRRRWATSSNHGKPYWKENIAWSSYGNFLFWFALVSSHTLVLFEFKYVIGIACVFLSFSRCSSRNRVVLTYFYLRVKNNHPVLKKMHFSCVKQYVFTNSYLLIAKYYLSKEIYNS